MTGLPQYDPGQTRCRIVMLGMLLCLAFLMIVLWHVQVAGGHGYESSLMQQSVRKIRIPGERGRILDRAGVPLADNRASYGVALRLEQLRRPGSWERTVAAATEAVTNLSRVLELEPRIGPADVRTHISRRLPLPLLAWVDLDPRALARLAESGRMSGGVDVSVEAVRQYPQGALASHLLGYVGRADLRPGSGEPFDYALGEMSGKAGLERQLDLLLGGRPGRRIIRVDARGYQYDVLDEEAPSAGSDVRLTIDARIQRLAEQALGGEPGAAVVIDPRSGDVLALASSPGYDPNSFVPSIPTEAWQTMTNDERVPLLNRAIAGVYPPGSIFKPLVAIAALESGRATAGTEFDCPGYVMIGPVRMRCWNENGHGRIGLEKAIEQSCNAYFAGLGLRAGYDAIHEVAASVGLGRKTGLGLDFEAAGLLPDAAWKRRALRDGWRDGDTANVSIGQGALGVTPVQMAVVAATIANDGVLRRPRLVLGVRAKGAEAFTPRAAAEPVDLRWSAGTLRLVKAGMHDVIESETGTGKRARIPQAQMAGKTGTAEYATPDGRRKRGWMMIFAPYDRPRFAAVMVVEEAVSGGVTVAPRMRALMEGIFAGAAAGGADAASS